MGVVECPSLEITNMPLAMDLNNVFYSSGCQGSVSKRHVWGGWGTGQEGNTEEEERQGGRLK